MEKVQATKEENTGIQVVNFKAPGNYKDVEHPSFWECKLKPNPHYVGAADEVCVAMSECSVVTI